MTKRTSGSKEGKVEAIMLTLGVDFFKMYPGGEHQVRNMLEGMNVTDRYNWMQLCGSGVPKIAVKYCYLVWGGEVQYRAEIKEFRKNSTGQFNDGGIVRTHRHKNLCVLQGPVEPAPGSMPMKGFQGFRYSEYLF